jgi:RNA polymerase sigma-70 factor (ECF subfamily)
MTAPMTDRRFTTGEDVSAPPRPRALAERGTDPGDAMRQDPRFVPQADGSGRSQSLPEQWLSVHGDALFRYALLLVADEHRAEDLVQETLLAALEGHSRYSAAASERTWLIAILRNKVIDERRRARRRIECLADVDPVVEGNFNRFGKWRKPPSNWTPSPQSLLESQEFWAIFRGCLRALPMPMREAFALRVVEDIDASEVCRILEITRTNLWTMLYRARERLRRCLEAKWSIGDEA